MKKIKNFFSGFSKIQKICIGILSGVLVLSIGLTSFQLFHVLTPKKIVKKNSVVSIIKPSVDPDTVMLQTSEDAGKEYVDNTLFLGDSNTVRFMDFTDNEGNTYTSKNNTIAVVGMGVQAIDSLECMEFSIGTFSMLESVKILQPERILITFGTNNLTGSDTKESREAFISDYETQLKKIMEAYPYTDLIVNSIPPISKETVYKNLDALEIKHWNEAIYKMCEKNDWHYLNSFADLADETTGYAKEGMMDTDGLHLSKKGIHTLFSYIRTHASTMKDERPEIKEIPEIIGPKTDLYTVNPLNGDSFDESVLHPSDPPQEQEPPQPTPTEDITETPVPTEETSQPPVEEPQQPSQNQDVSPTPNESGEETTQQPEGVTE